MNIYILISSLFITYSNGECFANIDTEVIIENNTITVIPK